MIDSFIYNVKNIYQVNVYEVDILSRRSPLTGFGVVQKG